MKRLNKKVELSGSTLKWIAVITMMIDHTAAAVIRPLRTWIPKNWYHLQHFLLWVYPHMRNIGRIAFPIFCFLLVEGFTHTKNAARYARRLFIFALISEIPFDFALRGTLQSPRHQNVYFTLFFGLLVMMGIHYFESKTSDKTWQQALYWLAQPLIAVAGLYLAKYCYTDYGLKGVFLIEVLYFTRNSRLAQTVVGAVTISWEAFGTLAFVPIWFYNGKRGRQHKYFFYWFYPVHLVILGFLRLWLTS